MMKARVTCLVIGGVMVALAGSGCGGGDDTESAPTPDELAADLLAPGDLDGAWSVTVPDEDVADLSGVVTDEMQDQLPGFALCPDASEEAQTTATALGWDAFMQLELETDDPIQPPDDRTGHMIFLQQYLAATDPADTTTTFDLLRQGSEACLGDFEADEEGPGYVEMMNVPDLGDDSFGVLMTVEEAGGWAEWRLHHVIVRDGPTLMILVVTDIRAGDGAEPYFAIDDIGAIAQTAVNKL
jgi:hypothetical protein